ncbi:MAG: tetratricopeptide repeat protein [Deltaproteobacteria bacterium]|nr:tetratricopeptide repeat protein [Deltaproteobacteria bacterium]
MTGVLVAAFAYLASAAAPAEAQQPDYDRDCVEGFNKLLASGHNFKARFETAKGCLDAARPRLFLSTTKDYRTALRENIRTYYRVMVSAALTLQAEQWKTEAEISLEAFRTFATYMTGEYPEITPENIDHYFEDTESYVALGLLGGDFAAAAEAGRRALDTYAKFRGKPWIPADEAAGTGKAPDEIAGIASLSSLAALMNADLQAFAALGPDAARASMLRDQCRSFFAVADNPGASRSFAGLFIGEKRREFMSAVLKLLREVKLVEKETDQAAVSCGSNLAAFFARIGDMDTALKMYGEIAAVTLPTFDLDPALKKEVLPKLVGVIENPIVKGEAICALGDLHTQQGELAAAADMFGTAFKLLRGSGLAARATCWIRSACALGKKYIEAGKNDHAFAILNGAQEAAKAENVFPREKCAACGAAAAAISGGKTGPFRVALSDVLNANPGEADFAYLLGAIRKPDRHKAVFDEVAKKKPELLPVFVRGLLLSADPPDKWAMGIAQKHLALLNDEGKSLYRLKAAKALVKAGKDKEGAQDLSKYLREVPQRRFKEEFLAVTTWLAAGNHAKVMAELSETLDKSLLLGARDFNHVGDILFRSGKPGPAAQFYAKYRQKMPDSFEPAVKTARAKLAAGDVAGAVELYRAAGRYGQLSRSDIINAAQALVAQKKFDDAHAFLDAEIEADKNFADAYFTKGVIFSVQGQCKKAVEYYGRALFIDASNASAYTNMGYARLDCGETPEAVKAFQTAVGISKNKIDHYDSNLGLAIANLRMGNEQAAADHFKKALSLNPNLKNGLDALAKEGYVYTPAQAEDIKRLLSKYGR